MGQASSYCHCNISVAMSGSIQTGTQEEFLMRACLWYMIFFIFMNEQLKLTVPNAGILDGYRNIGIYYNRQHKKKGRIKKYGDRKWCTVEVEEEVETRICARSLGVPVTLLGTLVSYEQPRGTCCAALLYARSTRKPLERAIFTGSYIRSGVYKNELYSIVYCIL